MMSVSKGELITGRFSICWLLVIGLMALPSLGFANEGVNDPQFDALSDAIPGFQRMLNTPSVPETKFLDAKNKAITLKAFAGKALLVNFWATWCTPCVREMPDLNKLADEFGGESFEVVAVASGRQAGKTPGVFLKENGLDALDLYHDRYSSLMSLFDTHILPTTLIVDKQGRIRGGVMGAIDWNSEPARAAIVYLMKK